MEKIGLIIQIIIALGIINVWLIRYNKSSGWRGGGAKSLKEEFKIYGLPGWFMGLVGFLKLLFAAALIAGIWFPELILPAAIGIAVLMIGAIAMHVKVNDPLKKSLPAFTMLVLSAFLIFI